MVPSPKLLSSGADCPASPYQLTCLPIPKTRQPECICTFIAVWCTRTRPDFVLLPLAFKWAFKIVQILSRQRISSFWLNKHPSSASALVATIHGHCLIRLLVEQALYFAVCQCDAACGIQLWPCIARSTARCLSAGCPP